MALDHPLTDTPHWLARITRLKDGDWTGVRNEDLVAALREGRLAVHERVREAATARLIKETKRIARRKIGRHLFNEGQDYVDDVVWHFATVLIRPPSSNQAESGPHVDFANWVRSRAIMVLRQAGVARSKRLGQGPTGASSGDRAPSTPNGAGSTSRRAMVPIDETVEGEIENGPVTSELRARSRRADEDVGTKIYVDEFLRGSFSEAERNLIEDFMVGFAWGEVAALSGVPESTLRDRFERMLSRRRRQIEIDARERRLGLQAARPLSERSPRTTEKAKTSRKWTR